MQTVRWYGKRDIRVEQLATPHPGADDALIRIERVGLCGSDVEQFTSGFVVDPGDTDGVLGTAPQPMTLGHELVGIVETCASRPQLVGTRVIPDVVEGCGVCWWCVRHDPGLCPNLVVRGQTADGGLAEFFCCQAATLVPVPEQIDADTAVFAEPLAVAVRALAKVPEIRGAVCAIVGMGVIGNLIGQLCVARGTQVIGIDVAPHRMQQATDLGIPVFDPASAVPQTHAVTEGRGADVVFECAGNAVAFADSAQLCRSGGTIVLLGISNQRPPFAWRDAVLREITYVGSAAHVWDTDVRSAVNLLAAGVVDVSAMTSRVIALTEVADTLSELAEANTLTKVVVDPARSNRNEELR